MFGLKIFVRVQTFRRGPRCPRATSATLILANQCLLLEAMDFSSFIKAEKTFYCQDQHQCRPQYHQQHFLQNHFQWCQTVLTLPVSSTQGRTAIAACPLQLRGSPAEFESQTWIDEQGLVMHHYMKRKTSKCLQLDIILHLTAALHGSTVTSSPTFPTASASAQRVPVTFS